MLDFVQASNAFIADVSNACIADASNLFNLDEETFDRKI